MKFIVVYMTESADLYWDEFDSLEEAENYVANEINEQKAHILQGEHLKDCT